MSWIPAVEHHYPDPDTDVLVVMQDQTETWVDTAYLDRHGYWRCAGSHILVIPAVRYWQPYPTLPDDVGRKSAAGAPSAAAPPDSAAGGFPFRPSMTAEAP